MPKVNSYLIFNGTAEEAFNFYKSVFGGEFSSVQRYKDMNGAPWMDKITAEEKEKIIHMSLPMNKGDVLMGSDSIKTLNPDETKGNNYYVCLEPDSKGEADTLFNKLSAGGKVTMPIGDAPWNAYFGMFTDKYGAIWMISYDYNKHK